MECRRIHVCSEGRCALGRADSGVVVEVVVVVLLVVVVVAGGVDGGGGRTMRMLRAFTERRT